MYRRILLAVDPAGRSESAEPGVAALARRSGGEVLVVSVRDASSDGEAEGTHACRVEDAVRRLRAGGVAASALVRPPREVPVAEQIVEAARVLNADLVALGSRGRGSLGSVVFGSTGREVASKLGTPVLVVPGAGGAGDGPPAVRRVLVAVDGSDRSRCALAAARELAREHQAELLVLHSREEEEDEDGFPDELRVLADGGHAERLRVVRAAGPVAGEIARAADEWGADLVVLGSRRPAGLGGLLLGSVAWDVIGRSERPVLLAGSPAGPSPRTGWAAGHFAAAGDRATLSSS